MEEDTVVRLSRPGAGVADDPLLAVLREGARRMLTQAIEAEVEAFLARHAGLVDERGRRRLVRNGHAPERQIQTGVGPIEVRRPKLHDRGGPDSAAPIAFTSAILPPYLRRTRNLEELLPWLYLKGVSTGQFEEALAALLGPEAPGLPRRSMARPSATCMRSTKPRAGRRPRRRSITSSSSTGPSTTKPPLAWPKIERRCSPSTTSPPSIGSTCERRTPSKVRSPRSGSEPPRPRAACHAPPRSPWSSSSPSRQRAPGVVSMAPSVSVS
jgi:Transposase, Mutator family